MPLINEIEHMYVRYLDWCGIEEYMKKNLITAVHVPFSILTCTPKYTRNELMKFKGVAYNGNQVEHISNLILQFVNDRIDEASMHFKKDDELFLLYMPSGDYYHEVQWNHLNKIQLDI